MPIILRYIIYLFLYTDLKKFYTNVPNYSLDQVNYKSTHVLKEFVRNMFK